MQGGKPLARHQALRFDVAEMDVRLRAAQLLVDEAAAEVDSGRDAGVPVARAKLFATEAAGWICDRAVQLPRRPRGQAGQRGRAPLCATCALCVSMRARARSRRASSRASCSATDGGRRQTVADDRPDQRTPPETQTLAKFLRHLFICTNERAGDDARGSCSARGALEVAAALKEKVHACGLKRVVRVNKAGCLDQCAHGVTVVVYPEAVWYGGVTPADVDELVERHLAGGRARAAPSRSRRSSSPAASPRAPPARARGTRRRTSRRSETKENREGPR